MDKTGKPQQTRNHRNHNNRRPQGPRPEWEIVKEIQDAATGLMVQVRRLPIARPKFSMRVGSVGRDGQFSPFFQPEVQVENARVKMSFCGTTLSRLFDEATLYILEQLQAQEDDYIERKQYREHLQIQRTKGAPPKAGLRKLGERDAAKHQVTEAEAQEIAEHVLTQAERAS